MDNKEKLRILLKKVGHEAKVTYVDNTLEAKQKLVGGLIEVVSFEEDTDLLIVCNEEGKIIGLPPNTLFDFDYIAGDYFVIGDDWENGDFKSITDEQIAKAKSFIEERSFKYKENALKRIEKDKFEREKQFFEKDSIDSYEEWQQSQDDEYEKHIDEDYENKDLEEK